MVFIFSLWHIIVLKCTFSGMLRQVVTWFSLYFSTIIIHHILTMHIKCSLTWWALKYDVPNAIYQVRFLFLHLCSHELVILDIIMKVLKLSKFLNIIEVFTMMILLTTSLRMLFHRVYIIDTPYQKFKQHLSLWNTNILETSPKCVWHVLRPLTKLSFWYHYLLISIF